MKKVRAADIWASLGGFKTQGYITVSTQHTIRTLNCTTCLDLYLNHSQVLITIKTSTIQ
jgi:hypothetical protein